MSFKKFFDIIEKTNFSTWLENKADHVEKLDPDRFYPEEFRSIFGLPTSVSKFICELAVKEGVFEKHILLINPKTQRAIKSMSSNEIQVNEIFHDEIAELREEEQTDFLASDCKIIPYYTLKS